MAGERELGVVKAKVVLPIAVGNGVVAEMDGPLIGCASALQRG